MRLLRTLCLHPITLLSLVAVAFLTWVWHNVFRPKPQEVARVPNELVQRGEVVDLVGAPGPLRRVLPRPSADPTTALATESDKPRPPLVSAQVLPKLKPGMLRTEVETLVGAPLPHDVHPVMIDKGRVTYLASYEADLGPPCTVRPIRPHKPLDRDPVMPDPRTMVTLEFDATKPGHPLLEVHYPDPLF